MRCGGFELIPDAAAALTVPWVAIGGIDLSNAAEVVAAGAPGVAVGNGDPRRCRSGGTAREFKNLY